MQFNGNEPTQHSASIRRSPTNAVTTRFSPGRTHMRPTSANRATGRFFLELIRRQLLSVRHEERNNMEFGCRPNQKREAPRRAVQPLSRDASTASAATICYVSCRRNKTGNGALDRTSSYALALSLSFVSVRSNTYGLKFGPISFWTSR